MPTLVSMSMAFAFACLRLSFFSWARIPSTICQPTV